MVAPSNCSVERLGRFASLISKRLVSLVTLVSSLLITVLPQRERILLMSRNAWRLSRRGYFTFQKFICMFSMRIVLHLKTLVSHFFDCLHSPYYLYKAYG